MLSRLLLISVLGWMAGSAAAEQTPVATVSTSGPLKVNGVAVPNAGVPTWPLVAGDEVATSTAAASIRFRDGTRITIGRNSRARVSATAATGIDVLQGTARFEAAPESKLDLRALGRPLDLQNLKAGLITVSPDKVSVGAGDAADKADASRAKGPKKPKPRSRHKQDDQDDDRP